MGPGKFTPSSFDVKVDNSHTLNYRSTPPSCLHRAAFDALQTLGIPDRCYGVHSSKPSTTSYPSGRKLVLIPDYLFLSHFSAKSFSPPTPQGSPPWFTLPTPYWSR